MTSGPEPENEMTPALALIALVVIAAVAVTIHFTIVRPVCRALNIAL